jgi:hypothetical protein
LILLGKITSRQARGGASRCVFGKKDSHADPLYGEITVVVQFEIPPFGSDIDYAMLVKIYGPAPEGQRRYSPAECIGAAKHRIEGNPDPAHISTSYAERQNLNIRMGNRRMTRLTNAFSKKAANHDHMMAIYFMHYNFVRIHQTLKVTPAMAAGVTAKLWEMADMVKVLEDWEQQ